MSAVVFKAKVKGETLKNRNLKRFDGKEVSVTIVELSKGNKRKWKSLSSLNLEGALDSVNLREYAHE